MSKKPLEFYFGDGSDIKDELENEAKKDLEKVADELEAKKKLAEKYVLNEEPIPSDLAKVYKSSYHRPGDVDLQNSEYTEITPEEAIQIVRKGDPSSLRLIIEGQLILIDGKYGSQNDKYRNRYVRRDHQYFTKTGNRVTDTARFPIPHLVKIADKIYKTNENQTPKDPNLMAQRSENRHSDYDYNRLYDTTFEKRGANIIPDRRLANKRRNYERELALYNKYLKEYEAETDENKKASLKRYVDSYKNSADEYYKDYKDTLNNVNDFKARSRYFDSEQDITKNIRKYRGELKPELEKNNKYVKNYQDELADFDAQGDPRVNHIKSRIADKRNELSELITELTDLEYSLDSAEYATAENRQKIVDKINNHLSNANNIKQEIDDLIHKNRNFTNSKNLFDEAAKANKTDDLVEIIESLYCNRKTTSAMLEQLEMNVDEVRSILEL